MHLPSIETIRNHARYLGLRGLPLLLVHRLRLRGHARVPAVPSLHLAVAWGFASLRGLLSALRLTNPHADMSGSWGENLSLVLESHGEKHQRTKRICG